VEAKKVSAWRNRYRVSEHGRVITTWDSAIWKSGGSFDLDQNHFSVRGNAWGTRYTLLDADGAVAATATGVGRKRWSVEAAGRTYDFQRTSMWTGEQELRVGGTRAGSVKKSGVWRHDIVADLPGLPLHVQVFVLGVIISMWEAQAAAAAAG
jgi:hypothetical protein